MKEVYLTQNKIAIVDDEDYSKVAQHCWHAHNESRNCYARCTINRKTVGMHRLVMNAQPTQQIDHIDGNGLNNCKSNLRFCSTRENCQNLHIPKSSKFPGVSWIKRDKLWFASIWINGKMKYLGYSKTEEDAYALYCRELEKCSP